MPWHIGRSDGCPDGRPFAVIKDDIFLLDDVDE